MIQNHVIKYLLEHPCVDCGEKDIVVLDFDHISEKKPTINYMLARAFSIKKIDEEIKKCEVRCANCHQRKTALQLGFYKDVIK